MSIASRRTPRRKPSSRTRPAISRRRRSSSPPSKRRRLRAPRSSARPTSTTRQGSRRRTVEGRRVRVPRPQARYRPQARDGADQGRARHGRLWLVRQCHLPRQGHAQEAVRHRFLVQARRRQAHPDGHPRAEGTPSRTATTTIWSRACRSPGGGSRCRSIPATWRSDAPGT